MNVKRKKERKVDTERDTGDVQKKEKWLRGERGRL